jgi:hypothetical protein
MLMTVYALIKYAKEIWCTKVRTVRVRPEISGISGYSEKISEHSELSEHQ